MVLSSQLSNYAVLQQVVGYLCITAGLCFYRIQVGRSCSSSCSKTIQLRPFFLA